MRMSNLRIGVLYQWGPPTRMGRSMYFYIIQCSFALYWRNFCIFVRLLKIRIPRPLLAFSPGLHIQVVSISF